VLRVLNFTQSSEQLIMNTPLIPVKFVMKEGARLPLKHTAGSCGRDLLTLHEVIMQPGEIRVIDTGKLID
jgi:dUTPase